MNKLILDIETIPNQKLTEDQRPKFDETTVKIGNLKDEKKIAEKIASARAEFETGLTKKMSVESNFCQILSIGFIELDEHDKVTRQDVYYDHDSDESLLNTFLNVVYDGQTIIGWNCKNFDIPVLWKRCILNRKKSPFENYRKLCNPYTDEAIDLMYHWNAGGYGKMKDCAALLGIQSKDGMDGTMIYEAWKNTEIDKIKEYNMADCRTTLAIYCKIYA